MFHKKMILVFITLLLFFGVVEAAQQESQLESVSVKLVPAVGSDKNPIYIKYKGKQYGDKGLKFSVARKEQENLLSVEKFVIELVDVLREGSPVQFAKFWEPKSQASIVPFYESNKGRWDREKSVAQAVSERRFVQLILYGDYALIQILEIYKDGKYWVRTYPVKIIGSDYYLSNDLKEDPLYTYILEKYGRDFANKVKGVESGSS
ncbi:MAG: hypothetical protein L3K24_16935 [Gammaproteobacteria bacterium]|nr:hypothetical protein [Gammaproteobacteria bacterium]